MTLFKEVDDFGINLSLAENPKPVQRKFKFVVPICYQAAILISKYDLCIRRFQSVKALGFMSSNQYDKSSKTLSKALRRLFHSLEQYKDMQVTFEDIAYGNARARDAAKAMGPLPLTEPIDIKQAM